MVRQAEASFGSGRRLTMAVVEYKYTPDQMPIEELKRTFAARQGLLDLVLKHVREQTRAASLSSFLLIGPRGSGKTTLVLMLRQCIREEAELAAAWLPLRFHEEQFEVCSLRDLLAAAVRGLAEEGIAGAEAWSSRVEQAAGDEESQSLAVAALRDIAKSQGKRLILFVENLNLLMARAFDETSQATLRRLLMVDPFLMLVGTAVQTFEEVEGYDKALFNYFHPLHLERLTDDQMCELLTRRAEYDGNTEFIERLGEHRPKLRALSRVTGGNPRFLLMVYEILSEGGVTSAVDVLRRLVDELTPLLKHVLEDLPPQQAKILDALMRAGGTATPAGLAQATRLKLNAVTAQLRRLKDNRMVEVLGGGKGQTAYYTIPDQLFCTWYQMRYLQRNRRRIELFVEVIRLWFEAEERLEHLRRLVDQARQCDGQRARLLAESAEYFAAALSETPHEDAAKQILIQCWLKVAGVVETAMAHSGLSSQASGKRERLAVETVRDLLIWCQEHGMSPELLESARREAEAQPEDLLVQVAYALCAGEANEFQLARDQLDRCLVLPIPDRTVKSYLTRLRAATDAVVAADAQLSNAQEQLSMTVRRFLECSGRPVSPLTASLVVQIRDKWSDGDYSGVISHCSRLVESGGLPSIGLAVVLALRAVARSNVNDPIGSQGDFTEAFAKSGLPCDDRQFLLAILLVRLFMDLGAEACCSMSDVLVRAIESSPLESRTHLTVRACYYLVGPEHRESWPVVVRRVYDNLSPQTAKSLEFLLPVAEVLEGQDLSVLDRLPSEERAFAVQFLARFDPKDHEPEDAAPADDLGPQ